MAESEVGETSEESSSLDGSKRAARRQRGAEPIIDDLSPSRADRERIELHILRELVAPTVDVCDRRGSLMTTMKKKDELRSILERYKAAGFDTRRRIEWRRL